MITINIYKDIRTIQDMWVLGFSSHPIPILFFKIILDRLHAIT